MKTKLFVVLTVLALTLALQPAPTKAAVGGPSALQCAQICMVTLCIQGHICGLFTNSSGQTVCDCHPR